MVKVHCAKEATFKIDLKDFFPNIKSYRIYSLFLRFSCSKEIAKLLAEIVTFNGLLPQGFPTSPMIANLVANKLDIEQLSTCEKYSITRTRWIDDIVFSGRIKSLELTIPKLIYAISINHFNLNMDKEKFYRRKNKILKLLG